MKHFSTFALAVACLAAGSLAAKVTRQVHELSEQMKALQNLWQPGKAAVPGEGGGMNLDLIEASLVAMAKEGATPELGPLIDQIFALTQDMKNEIIHNQNHSQYMINHAWEWWTQCHVENSGAFVKDLTGWNKSHIECSWHEGWYWKEYQECMAGCNELNKTNKTACEYYENKFDVYPPINHCRLDEAHDYGGLKWTFDKMWNLWDFYSKRYGEPCPDPEARDTGGWMCWNGTCNETQTNLSQCVESCRDEYTEWAKYFRKCTHKQWDMEKHACGEVTKACTDYRRCWWERRENFLRINKTVSGHEKAYKSEWRGIERIECLLQAFKDSIAGTQKLSYGIQVCIQKDFRKRMECTGMAVVNDQASGSGSAAEPEAKVQVCEDNKTQCACPCPDDNPRGRSQCSCAQCPYYLEHLDIVYPGPNWPLRPCGTAPAGGPANITPVPGSTDWINKYYLNDSMPHCTEYEPCCAECCEGGKQCLKNSEGHILTNLEGHEIPPACVVDVTLIHAGLADGSITPDLLGGPDSVPLPLPINYNGRVGEEHKPMNVHRGDFAGHPAEWAPNNGDPNVPNGGWYWEDVGGTADEHNPHDSTNKFYRGDSPLSEEKPWWFHPSNHKVNVDTLSAHRDYTPATAAKAASFSQMMFR